MPLSSTQRKALEPPIKKALAANAVSVSSDLLDGVIEETEAAQAREQVQFEQESEKAALDAIFAKINDVVDQLGLEDMLGDFGPKNNGAISPPEIPNNTGHNFADTPNDDIIDEKKEPKKPNAPISPPPKENEAGSEQNEKPQNKSGLTPEQEEAVAEELDNDLLEDDPEEEEEQPQPEVELPPEKNKVTQTINVIWYRNQIKAINKQLKKLDKQENAIKQAIKRRGRTLAILHAKKWPLEFNKKAVDAIRKVLSVFLWTCGCCILFFLMIPAKISHALLTSFSKLLEQMLKKIDTQIAEIQKGISLLRMQIMMLQKQQAELIAQIHAIVNRGLMDGVVTDIKDLFR